MRQFFLIYLIKYIFIVKHLFFSKEGAAVVANEGILVTVIPKSKYDDEYKALSKSLFVE